ncbi:MAG: carboxypeptidase Taq [Actinomycetota bacterium]|nr:carboxypeptidase Taq [Actinomycetota bacterium]
MNKAWEQLVERVSELEDIVSAIKLASYDQEVFMPPKGGPARAKILATMSAIAHDRLKNPAIGEILLELEHDDSLTPLQGASVRVLRRDFDKATKLPEKLVRELAELEAQAYQAWTQARPQNDFSQLQPFLERMIELKKQQADTIGWTEERYDALLDDFEPGMLTSEVEVMFGELEAKLRPIVQPIIDAAGERPALLSLSYDRPTQEEFSAWLVGRVGFDFEGGRLDTSPHPFTSEVSQGDVRQTIRSEETAIMMSIYSGMHETGHALYEQGIPDEFRRLPVGQVPSLGMHESQSRLWENQVGRSRPFSEFILAHLAERFPEQLRGVGTEEFYRAVNHPSRSLIRVAADELTYNLHVALRFELEVAMFRDELEVKDLPGAWNEATEKWVGITPPSDADGVLQDMHWSIGAFGYFPTYSLGTLYAAALFDRAKKDLGNLNDELREGDTSRVLGWLQDNFYSQGYLYPAKELMTKILGEPPTATPFVNYLRSKYEDLYGIKL